MLKNIDAPFNCYYVDKLAYYTVYLQAIYFAGENLAGSGPAIKPYYY